jgi:hypothetical protein
MRAFILLGLATASAYQLVTLGVGASSRATPPTMAAKKAREDKFSAAPVVGAIDVTPAAEEIEAAMQQDMFMESDIEEVVEVAATPSIPKIDIDVEAVESFAIKAFKMTSTAIKGIVDFSKDNDVLGKSKNAVQGVIDFEKKNEVLLKSRAALEIGVDKLTPLAASTVEQLRKSSTKSVPKASKGAKPSKAKKPSMAKKPQFEMPKIDLPKFK